MILLNNVIQIFTLTDFDAAIIIGIILIGTRFIGSTFIDIYEPRFTISTNSFIKKTQSCPGVACSVPNAKSGRNQ